jgi:ABC-2 type transport system permease protein
MNAVYDSRAMSIRWIKALIRQPWWIAIMLVQPVVWLLLYGALFKNVIEIPGFHGGDYKQFIAPGIVVMTALFSSGWGGMGTVQDLEAGVVDRFLVTPVGRTAMLAGPLVQASIMIAIQSVIIVGLALAVGATFPGGVAGVVVLIAVAVLLGVGFGAMSHGVALLARQEETMVGLMNFLLLPLTFLSTAFMQADLVPGWIREVAKFNPVNWAVEAGREAAMGSTDWGVVASRSALLAAFSLVMATFAVRAFRTYQRSV